MNHSPLRAAGWCMALLFGYAVVAPAPLEAQSAPSARTASATAPSAAALAAAIDSIALEELRSGPIPGLSIAVVRGRDTLVMRGYGLANVEHDVPAAAETVYRIGSITKQFTAAAILRLAEEGKLALQDPVSRYLPDLPDWSQRVTIAQLLNHTSGIRSYTGLGPRWTDRMRLDLSHEELVALFKDEPADFAPGERWLYNNSGYYLAGMIIEQVTGQPYAEYLRQAFYEPLGLRATSYCSDRAIVRQRAAGYNAVNGEFLNAEPLSMNQPFAAGALCSTVRDLVVWTSALTRGQVVAPESYAQMIAPTALPEGNQRGYGYGLSVGELEGHRWVAHGGGINGFITQLSYYPEQDLTIAVLTNSGNANPSRIERRIARRVLGIPAPVVKDLPLRPAERARYVGTYDVGIGKIQVLEQEGKLQLTGPVNSPLLYQGNHTFVAAADSDTRVVFRLDRGRASEVRLTVSGTTLEGKKAP